MMADAVGLALLVVLDTLGPAERIAFVLHDLFAVPFEEIASIEQRTPEQRDSSQAGHGDGCAALRMCLPRMWPLSERS